MGTGAEEVGKGAAEASKGATEAGKSAAEAGAGASALGAGGLGTDLVGPATLFGPVGGGLAESALGAGTLGAGAETLSTGLFPAFEAGAAAPGLAGAGTAGLDLAAGEAGAGASNIAFPVGDLSSSGLATSAEDVALGTALGVTPAAGATELAGASFVPDLTAAGAGAGAGAVAGGGGAAAPVEVSPVVPTTAGTDLSSVAPMEEASTGVSSGAGAAASQTAVGGAPLPAEAVSPPPIAAATPTGGEVGGMGIGEAAAAPTAASAPTPELLGPGTVVEAGGPGLASQALTKLGLVDKAGNFDLTKAFQLGLSGAGIAMMSRGLTPHLQSATQQFQQLSAPLKQAADQLIAQYNSGKLTAADTTSIENWKKAALAQTRDFYARSGISDSTQAMEVERRIEETAVAMADQARQGALKQAISAYGAVTPTLTAAIQADAQTQAATEQAQVNFFNLLQRVSQTATSPSSTTEPKIKPND